MPEAWSRWEGQVIDGRFELKQCLGSSGQSAVFLTEICPQHPPGQTTAERPPTAQPPEDRPREAIQLAIKLIAADPAHTARQLSRWRLAQILYHPSLLRVFDTGRCRLGGEDLIFGVMEYADENLAQIIPARPLTIDEARQMLEPTLEALAYLHGQGLVHGRLTPANVMAMGDSIKLSCDWISPVVSETKESVADLQAGSDVVYEAPEIASGKQSAASDVWSLGMLLSQALTQHLPVQNGSNAEDPRLPEDFPAPFLEIVRGCLRRDPHLRWTVDGITLWLHPETSVESARSDAGSVAPTTGAHKVQVLAEKPASEVSTAQPVKTTTAATPSAAQKPPASRQSLTPQPPAAAKPSAAASLSPSSQAIRQGAASRTPPAKAKSPAELSTPLDLLSWTVPLIRRFAVPAMVAIAAMAALYAAFGLLHRESSQHEPGAASSASSGDTRASSTQQPAPSTSGSQKPRPGSSRSGTKPSPSGSTSPDNRNHSALSITSAPVNTGSNISQDLGIVRQVMPAASQSALATIEGAVRVSVKVKVDSAGNTTAIELATRGPSAYFARLSQQAAQEWKFTPSLAGRSFLLHFEFRNSGIKASVTRAGV